MPNHPSADSKAGSRYLPSSSLPSRLFRARGATGKEVLAFSSCNAARSAYVRFVVWPVSLEKKPKNKKTAERCYMSSDT